MFRINHRLRLVLDLDDTLYPEQEYVRSGFDAVGKFLGNDGFAEQCWQLFQAGQRGRIFDEVLLAFYGQADPKRVEELVGVYRNHPPRIHLYPDAKRLLDQAAKLSVPLGLITDGPSASQRAKIHALDLDSKFQLIVVTSELGTGCAKPHPAAFELMQRTLGDDANYIYIADNPAKDFIAPNRAGWGSIRVHRPDGLYSRTEPLNASCAPQTTIAALDDVENLLHK